MRAYIAGYYLIASVTVASASDTYIGDVYINNRFAYTLGEFYDLKHCSFVGRGVENAAKAEAFRPYDTPALDAMRLLSTEVKCRKAP